MTTAKELIDNLLEDEDLATEKIDSSGVVEIAKVGKIYTVSADIYCNGKYVVQGDKVKVLKERGYVKEVLVMTGDCKGEEVFIIRDEGIYLLKLGTSGASYKSIEDLEFEDEYGGKDLAPLSPTHIQLARDAAKLIKIPRSMYHVTLSNRYPLIKSQGLKVNSRRGVSDVLGKKASLAGVKGIYLVDSMRSYDNTGTYIPDPLVLKVDTSKLDRTKFMLDPEQYGPSDFVPDEDSLVSTINSGRRLMVLVYDGNVPANNIEVTNLRPPNY